MGMRRVWTLVVVVGAALASIGVASCGSSAPTSEVSASESADGVAGDSAGEAVLIDPSRRHLGAVAVPDGYVFDRRIEGESSYNVDVAAVRGLAEADHRVTEAAPDGLAAVERANDGIEQAREAAEAAMVRARSVTLTFLPEGDDIDVDGPGRDGGTVAVKATDLALYTPELRAEYVRNTRGSESSESDWEIVETEMGSIDALLFRHPTSVAIGWSVPGEELSYYVQHQGHDEDLVRRVAESLAVLLT